MDTEKSPVQHMENKAMRGPDSICFRKNQCSVLWRSKYEFYEDVNS